MALGKRLLLAREKRELTQGQLAQKVYGNDDAKHQARISALETRDSQTSTSLFAFCDALNIQPRWLQDGELPSGLEENVPASAPDRLLEQLINLWGQLDQDRRDEVLALTNKLHAQQYPLASTSNPYGKSKRRPAKTPAKAKQKTLARIRR